MTRRLVFFRSVTVFLLLITPAGCSRNGSTPETVSLPQPKETVDEIVKQNYQTDGKPNLLIDTFSGSIAFEPAGDNAVQIEVLKQGWGETREEAADNLKKIELTLKQEGDTIRVIAANLDKPANQAVALKDMRAVMMLLGPGKADIKIKAPAQSALEFKSGHGNITATGGANRLKAASNSGNILVKKNSAEFDLGSGYGGISIEGSAGGKAKTNSGAIDVRGCQQPVMLESGYGTIDVANAAGVTARTNSGAINIKSSKSPMLLHTGYGQIDVQDASGSAKAETNSGDVHIVGDKGDYQVKSGYGTVRLEVKDSPVHVETSSGNIEIKGASGNVKAHSGYGNVNVTGENATLDLRSNSGSIGFNGSLASGSSHISSGYGETSVKLPASASFKLQAKTGYGSIHSNFEITKTKDTPKEWIGTIGTNPEGSLLIESNSGNVNIDKR